MFKTILMDRAFMSILTNINTNYILESIRGLIYEKGRFNSYLLQLVDYLYLLHHWFNQTIIIEERDMFIIRTK